MLRNATFFRFSRKFGKLGFHITSYIIEGCGYLSLCAHSMSIRPKCMIEKELRHNRLRSLFCKKAAILLPFWVILPPFCPPTGFESDRCQRPTSPRKPGWSPTCTWLLFSRPRPPAPPRQGQRGQVVRGPPRWLLPAIDRRIDKDRMGPDLDERPLYIECITEPGDSCGEISPLFLARRRRTLDHSLLAGGA